VFATGLPSIIDGMGGISLANARTVCETLGVEWTREIMVKVLAAATAYLEARQQGQNPATFGGN